MTAAITYSSLLSRAWPIILANAAVPLLGLVDTAVIGNFGTLADLGAIALGSLIFSFVYWGLGFLRMSTTGFAAQAAGAGDHDEVRAVLGRALLLAAVLGCLLIALQTPIGWIAFRLLDASDSVESIAGDYFGIRIWGAPAALAGFVSNGLLIGLGRSRSVLALQLFLNFFNIFLDIVFAGLSGWGARGIALGTIIAEWVSLGFAAWLIAGAIARSPETGGVWSLARVLDRARLTQMASANFDIMVRTLILVFSFGFFVNQGALFGDVVLAANHLLLQLITFSAFFLDGYAFVVESLVGSAKGGRQLALFDQAVRRSTILALATAVGLAAAILLAGPLFIAWLTDIEAVRRIAGDLRYWAAAYVLLSFAAFQLDGIFIGASHTAAMRNAACLSIGVFLLAWWLGRGLGVQGLWLAMVIYVLARAAALALFYGDLRQRLVTRST